jgi:hypothetical protein
MTIPQLSAKPSSAGFQLWQRTSSGNQNWWRVAGPSHLNKAEAKAKLQAMKGVRQVEETAGGMGF